MSARANRVTEAYLAECTTPDSGLRGALAELDVSETMRAAWPRLLPRPVMVDEAEFRAFGQIGLGDPVRACGHDCLQGVKSQTDTGVCAPARAGRRARITRYCMMITTPKIR